MTDGERMVWAAEFVRAIAGGDSNRAAARSARLVVLEMRDAGDEHGYLDPAAKAMLADMLAPPPPAANPTPAGWPSAFDPAAAEALIAATLEEFGNAPGICDLVCEFRWAIAQIRAERAATGGAR